MVYLLPLFVAVFIVSCTQSTLPPIVVNSVEDNKNQTSLADSEETVTLRSALSLAADGQHIVFDPSLDGGTIELSIVGEEHSILKGEVMGMKVEPSGLVSYLVGYFERDYGKSALYARKDVVIDASSLPSGITLAWTGGESNPARVLAIYGDLTMINVSVTGGWSVAEALPENPAAEHEQISTRARGGGIAVWGTASLSNCTLYDNHCKNEVPDNSRDSGSFGGGLYADIVDMENCVLSGNSVTAGGVSGGGVFSVGGAEYPRTASTIKRSSITCNRISGYFAYGGGVYSDGGGIGNQKTLELINCTIARNVVDVLEPVPFGYWRGGGVYMSNGDLYIQSCTVVENEVYGVPRTDALDKPNLAGGVAATIGNAHAVEHMTIGHSVIAGNTVHEIGEGGTTYEHDVFTGSLLHFKSMGYNRIGIIDFSQILVPVGKQSWVSLSRKHYPKEGDEDGVDVSDVLDLSEGITYSDSILSVGVDAHNSAVLRYEPRGSALDQIPSEYYAVYETYAEYAIRSGGTNAFLSIVLDRLAAYYNLANFAAGFTTAFETFLQTVDSDTDTPGTQPYTDPLGNSILFLADTQWFGPAETWPKELSNYPYIEFWHRLDSALRAENIPGMGPELIGDNVWISLFSSGALIENEYIVMLIKSIPQTYIAQETDQIGTERPVYLFCDIGAIELH